VPRFVPQRDSLCDEAFVAYGLKRGMLSAAGSRGDDQRETIDRCAPHVKRTCGVLAG
jgi:hypothetical protein